MDEGFRAGAFNFLRAIEDERLNRKSVYANGKKSRKAKTALALLMLLGNTRNDTIMALLLCQQLLLNHKSISLLCSAAWLHQI